MLSFIVRSLDQVTRISEELLDLWRRHQVYEVKEHYYVVFRDAFLSMLTRLLGPNLPENIHEAWAAAYDMLARIMCEAPAIPHTSERFYGAIIRSIMASQYGVAVAKDRGRTGGAQITHDVEFKRVARISE
jgi:hypothetical protein